MRLRLIAPGSRMPDWVQAGFHEYARRLPSDNRLELLELPLARKGARDSVERQRHEEGTRILKALQTRERVVALDAGGRSLATATLAETLERWRMDGRDVALIVGGPEGLAPACMAAAEWAWSLSPLTLPHGLVRVIVAEQLYRAWTILAGHPYHR